MNKPKTYKVYCNGTGMFPHFGTLTGQDGAQRRFIGWQQVDGSWVPRTEPETIQACAEYQRAIRLGDLLPADQFTADDCGVPFTHKSASSK